MKKVISLKKILALVFAIFACHSVLAYDFEADGIYYNIISEDDRTVEVANNGIYSGDVVIPSEVNYNYMTYTVIGIGDNAFDYCVNLTSVEIPGSIITIGDYAFYSCFGLTTVEVPSSVIAIGVSAFGCCADLREINVDKNNQSYVSEDGVLYTRTMDTLIQFPGGKTSVNFKIPSGVTFIEEGAFYDCYRLTSIEIPNSVTNIGEEAFMYCLDLTTVKIPNSVTTIGDNAFSCCYGLTTLKISNSVNTIERSVFSYCVGLTTVEIPNSVTTIEASAFYGCYNLTSVYCKAIIPPYDSENAFGEDTLKGTLYVPVGTKADYEAIDPWRNFETIEEYDFTVGVEEAVHGEEIAVVTDGNSIVVTGDNAGRIEVYSVNGRCVYCGHETTIGNLTKGVYVVKVNNNIFKVLL